MKGQKKNRPKIKFEIFNTRDKSAWRIFAKHHYLSHTHNNAAHTYVVFVDNQIAGFCSVLHMPNKNPKLKRVHRLVVLPDYQGIGIGGRLLDFIAKKYNDEGYTFSITTSTPSLIFALKKHIDWKCYHHGRSISKDKMGSGSQNRITTAFRYIQNGTK